MTTAASSPSPASAGLDDRAFRELYDTVRATASPPPGDRRGTLRHLTPQRTKAALREVRSGQTVSLAAPVETERRTDNPSPWRQTMTGATADAVKDEGLDFAADRLALNVHGNVDSHIDALCHVVFDGRLYNDVPVGALTAGGAQELSIDIAHDGVVGRGVLLDITRSRGQPWLEPGATVTYDDLLEAERQQALEVGPGDILLIRVGHRRRRNELGPWDVASVRAGLHPQAVRFAAERQIAALGCDSNSDTAPSVVPSVQFPVHVLAINAIGLHLLDYLQFDELADLCEARGSWSFLCMIAPLRIPAATGSPVNPIAVL